MRPTLLIMTNKITHIITLFLILFTTIQAWAGDYTVSTSTGWVKNSNGPTSGQTYYKWWYSNETDPLITIESGAGNAIAVSGTNLSFFPGAGGNNVTISVGNDYVIKGVSFDYQSNGSTMSYNSESIVTANASGSWSKQNFNSSQVTFRFGGSNFGTVLSNFIVTMEQEIPDAPYSLSPKGEEWQPNTRWYYLNLPLTGGYLGFGVGYNDANGLIVNNLARPQGDAGLWAFVKKGDRVQLYNKAAGTSLVLSAPSGGDPEKLAMLNKTLTVDNVTTVNPLYVKENAWSLLPTRKDVNGTQDGYFIYRHNTGVWHRCVVFENNYLVTAYSNGWSSNASSMENNLMSKIILVPSDANITRWTVNIVGGTSEDRVIFCGVEYESGTQIETETLSPSNISTNITGRIVFGPIIDTGNHTVTFHVRSQQDVTDVTGLSQITDPFGFYRLTSDIVSPTAAIDIDFQGYLDGNYHKITGQTEALFETINGAHIKNLILDDVSISGATVGAIANEATGNSRIYNCGVLSSNNSTITGSVAAGSIVGRITGNARVVNCYSYANVSGGTVAGIVGNNAGTSATKETVFAGGGTLVMNCAYFGSVSGTSVYPVFGGNDIENISGVNTYNYYLYDATKSYTSPNSAQGTEETSYFNRFDFYRGILNSHQELAAMYIFGTQNITQAQRDEIAHWKYDSDIAEYLTQEAWPKNTRSILDRNIPSTAEPYKGKQVGTISATFIINGHNENITLPLTDMDKDRWDYTYGKVVLPFANEFTGWTLPASGSNNYDNIITGWEVTSISGGTPGTYSNYDLCDPDCTNKDLYANNNYVWAQGGNFVVPKGVTSVTFTAHIARAVYLRDVRPDYSYSNDYASRTEIGSAMSGTYNGKTIYNSMDDAFAHLEAKTNPADQAIVLVGNYHLNKEFYESTRVTRYEAKAVTFMSIDADNNQDPDYCLYQFNTQGSGRVSMPPVRFDFLALPGFGVASYTKGGYIAEMGIIHSKGWLETTETATLSMTEFEMRPEYYTQASPVILNGGVFSKIIMTSNNEYLAATDKLLYTKIGGKAYVNSLNLGRANDIAKETTLALHPLNVSGGEIITCHLTGAKHDGSTSGNAYFYCNGGYIHEFNGAYQERLNGDMVAKMDHALIDEFYGGGADDAYNDAQISGNINITCNNSYIKFFCGGPKFGNMAEGKTVTVNATGSTFDEYYGASYGGTAITTGQIAGGSVAFSNADIIFNMPWSNYTSKRLTMQSLGIGVDFDIDFFQYAGGGKNTGNQSFYVKYASLSLAKTGSVTSNMINCTFNGNFFGGGCRGLVAGDVTSTLHNCIVNGNAYGGGYTPTATQCMVYPASPQPTYPVYKGQYGLFTKYVRTVEPEAYTWQHVDNLTQAADEVNKIIFTTVDMTQMGSVTGNTSLTITGAESVVAGDVFGGGAESRVDGNSTVVIGTAPAEHVSTQSIQGNVYGGGQVATIGGNTTVMIHDGHFSKNIFGGGEGQLNGDGTVKASADISGNTRVEVDGGVFDIRQITSGADAGRLAEDYNIYGGGNVACRVGTMTDGILAENTGNATIQMTAGMAPQSFFASDQYYTWSMYINTQQNKPVQCGVFGAGYGKNTEVLGNTDVTIYIGAASETLATEEEIMQAYNLGFTAEGATPEGSERLASAYVANVMGGGYDGIVRNNTHVTVQGNPYIFNVFGGGLGSLNGAGQNIRSEVGTVFGGATVDVLGGTIFGNVFGSGAGIAGDVDVLGDGTKILPYYTPAWVRRQTVVNIGHKENETTTGKGIIIFGNVHGGGDIANTGWYDEAARPTTRYTNKAGVPMDITSSVNLFAGNVLGSVFGGGNGRAKMYDGYCGAEFRTNGPEYIGSICGSTVVKLDGAKVWGNLYGGGHTGQVVTVGTGQELDRLQGGSGMARTDEQSACASVEIFSGWVGSNVFGGGFGDVVEREGREDVVTKANIGMSTFTYFIDANLIGYNYWTGTGFAEQNNTGANRGTASDILHNLYGGGDVACDVTRNVFIYVQGSPSLPDGYQTSQFYLNASEDTGLPRFSVFGGGYGKYACVNGSAYSDINLRAGTGIFHAVCGGLNGPIGGSSSMHIGCDANSLIHDVYGGGYYANIGENTNVTITAGRIRDNVFAGGMMGDIGTNAGLQIGLGEGEHVDFQDDQAGRHYSLGNMHNDIVIYGSVYGGNDVSGVIGGGSQLTIKGGTVMKNVYGSGNGDYIYQWDGDVADVTEVRNDGDYIYYKVPKKYRIGDTFPDYGGDEATPVQKLLTINSYHPSVSQSHITIAGANETYRANILGNVYCGGNASSVEGQSADIQLTLGSHATINGLYLGSDGKDYTAQAKITEFESKNGFDMTHDLTSEEQGCIGAMGPYYATMLALYMYPVEMQTQPALNYEDNLTDLYIGTFCGGGDRGSMLVNRAASVTIPTGVTIFDKVVAGCSDANVIYHGKTKTVSTTGGYIRPIFDATQQENKDATKLHYTISCDFTPKKLSKTANETKYLVDNINGASYGDGCNVYGGCYKSGIIIGDVVLNVQSNMLKDALSSDANKLLLNNASANDVPCFNIYGAGFDMNSFVYGNVNITLDNSNNEGAVPADYANTHPSCNNIYGGGRNGYLVGNASINVKNGIVYRHIIGGSDAGYLYGNTQIAVGDPQKYTCNTKGTYTLNRADTWNTGTTAIRTSIKTLEGDVISDAVYNTLFDADKGNFDANSPSMNWTNRKIYIGGGIYGGGYALATGSTIYAGDKAVKAYTAQIRPVSALNYGQPIAETEGFGGNATIMIADEGGSHDHITISTPVASINPNAKEKMGLFDRVAIADQTDGLGNQVYQYKPLPAGTIAGTNTQYYSLSGIGGVFGDGHLSFVEGFRSVDVQNYGYADFTPQGAKLLNTFQRFDIAHLHDCCIMLQGGRDFTTNSVDATTYSISRVGELQLESSLTGELSASTEKKSRNYLGFFNNVHYLGAVKSNTPFVSGQSFYDTKKTNISLKSRNVGTAPNMIGIANGHSLKLQNYSIGDDGNDVTFYGPIVGVCEVDLIALVEGEGGGYVYADNIHEDGVVPPLYTSGNFVFPENANSQYIVDDCFSDDAHYWYVEGNKYWFTNTITGYTYGEEGVKTPITFEMDNVDQIITLSGTTASTSVRVKSITWEHEHSGGYTCDITNGSKNYAFAISLSGNAQYDMPRTNVTPYAAIANDRDNPLLAVRLTDTQINNTAGYWKNHLSEPCKAVIVLESGTAPNTYTYTLNLNVKYLQGPRVSGAIHIDNCALPGELIHAEVDNLVIETDESMPVTGTSWRLVNPDDDMIDPALKYHDVTSFNNYIEREKIDVLAQQQYDGWKLEYTINSSGQSFPVSVGNESTHPSLLVHNYHDMKQVWDFKDNPRTNLAPHAGARIYIRNREGWDAFVQYLNASADGLAGMKIYLQTDITLDAAPAFTKAFAGEFNGDGYTVKIPDGSLFGDNLTETATIYNIGVVGGTIADDNTRIENYFDNTHDDVAAMTYGKLAYDLSHHFATTDAVEGYIKANRYAGDWQYARVNTADSRMLRTAATPNYGSALTAHNTAHAAAVINEHDCLFFGQPLNPIGITATPYPQHIDDSRSGENWVEANRVHLASGYYRSKAAGQFYYNKAAWAMTPGLTAVRFTGENVLPTSFGNSDADDDEKLPGYKHVTKNLLVYAPVAIAKAANTENFFMVSGTEDAYTCPNLALLDMEDFNAPYAFTATKASYQRDPSQETGYAAQSNTAWQSIALPFAPQKTTLSNGITRHQDAAHSAVIYEDGSLRPVVEGELQQDISFFWGTPTSDMLDTPTTNDRTLNHEYWLRELTSINVGGDGTYAHFKRPLTETFAEAFEAYKPYIFALPGDRYYEFDMTDQTVTFSADNAAIDITDDAVKSVKSNGNINGMQHISYFLNGAVDDAYAIERGSTGDSFKKDAAIFPFRTYIIDILQLNDDIVSPTAQLSKETIFIGAANAPIENLGVEEWQDPGTEEVAQPDDYLHIYPRNHAIVIESGRDRLLPCNGISGTRLGVWQIHRGTNTFSNLRRGIYVIAGRKVVVR